MSELNRIEIIQIERMLIEKRLTEIERTVLGIYLVSLKHGKYLVIKKQD